MCVVFWYFQCFSFYSKESSFLLNTEKYQFEFNASSHYTYTKLDNIPMILALAIRNPVSSIQF